MHIMSLYTFPPINSLTDSTDKPEKIKGESFPPATIPHQVSHTELGFKIQYELEYSSLNSLIHFYFAVFFLAKYL